MYIALARIFDYVTKTDTYIHKCMHIYVHQCLRCMYVIREIQVCLCVCMSMHVCMHMHIYTHIHTCVYVCMYVHGPDAGVPEQARFSGMHACMHVRMYVYVYTCRCKYIYIKIFKRSKQMTFRQAKTLFTCTQTMCTCTHAHSIRS